MFTTEKENLLKLVVHLQRKSCGYDLYGIMNDKFGPPRMCDCKYGMAEGKEKRFGSEQTGCPELRCVTLLLKNMTEKEYNDIMKRNNSSITPKEVEKIINDVFPLDQK